MQLTPEDITKELGLSTAAGAASSLILDMTEQLLLFVLLAAFVWLVTYIYRGHIRKAYRECERARKDYKARMHRSMSGRKWKRKRKSV